MSVINLYNGDCMEAMAKMPDKAYDLAICDPPYGIGENGGKSRARKKWACYDKPLHERKDWDNETPHKEYFIELKRVSKNQIIWGLQYFIENLNNSNSIITWDKQCENSDFSDFESAWTSFKGKNRIFRAPIQIESQKRIHPTQKPVALYKWLLKNYAKPGDKILDTHGGSMSIAIACHDMGFDLNLWELDEDYYNAGKERFERHCRQAQLFSPQQVVNFKQEGLL